MRFAYADPPYPGQAKRYYGNHPDYAGEVDHAALLTRLADEYPDGWALSTSGKALQSVLALCPPDVEIGIWHVTNASHPGRGNQIWRTWEPVIFRGGRRDASVIVRNLVTAAQPGAILGGTLRGQKPDVFCTWIFGMLGARPADTLDDLFPGSGAVGRAWESYIAAPTLAEKITSRWDQDPRYAASVMRRLADPLFSTANCEDRR